MIPPVELPHTWNDGDVLPHRDIPEGWPRNEPFPPKKGMGCTFGYGSDCYPGTIISVSYNAKTLHVVPDTYQYTAPPRNYGDPGKDEHWKYTFMAGFVSFRVYTKRKDGHYREKGCSQGTLGVGFRKYYMDPHL